MFYKTVAFLALVTVSTTAFVSRVPQPSLTARNALLQEKDYEKSLEADIKREVRRQGF